jgi:predicted DNA-binding protein
MGKLILNIVKPEPMVLVNYRFPRELKEGLQEIAKLEGHAEADIARHFLTKGIKEYFQYDQTKELEGAVE